jgi:hypothetical protein
MAYLGTKPQSGFISQEANQYFTGLTQNYIDLNQSISSLSSVIVLVNGVVQENSTMSLTSSTRITLGDTLVSADKVTCIYVAKISSTQAPATGTVTNDMLSGSIANSKLANSSITLNGSAVSLGGSATVGGDNTPAFAAYKSSADQSLSGGGDVKIQYNNEIFDSSNCYDNSTNYRFTPNVAGKYFFQASAYVDQNGGSGCMEIAGIKIKKNGSTVAKQRSDYRSEKIRTQTQQISVVLDMNGTSDYVEAFAHAEVCAPAAGQLRTESDGGSNFMGFKLIT